MAAATAQALDTQTAHIIIAEILPAQQQGRSARIKDTDGIAYGVWPNTLSNAQVGDSFEIEFASNMKNNVVYRDIRKMTFRGRQAATAQRSSQPTRSTPAQAATAPGAGQQGGSAAGGGYYRPTSPRDARRMFLCSTLNAFIQTGRIDCHEESIGLAIDQILSAYDSRAVMIERAAPMQE